MANANTLTFNSKNFQQQVLQATGPVLVDFWAEWCGPCKMLAPIIDELATEFQGRASVGKLDIDSNQDLAVQYGVTAIPTLMVFKGGQVVDMTRGLRSKRDLKELLDRAIGVKS